MIKTKHIIYLLALLGAVSCKAVTHLHEGATELFRGEVVARVGDHRLHRSQLESYIPAGCIGRIYLNFSCPFPKKSYASHRLTHRRFLEIYSVLLKPHAEIHQKTDNRNFFEFSLEEFSDCGWTMKNISLDLHASDFEDNIVTEYEKRFSEQGFPIYRLEAYRK